MLLHHFNSEVYIDKTVNDTLHQNEIAVIN